MASRLNRIEDWRALAARSGYCANTLAELVGISVRQLERFFLQAFSRSPHAWLHNLRMRKAAELLLDGSSVKETAILLGYKEISYFTHDFSRSFGIAPSQYPALPQPICQS